ncbi:putative F-box/LRR-repeat protein 23 isoform X3 [Lycium barbarum]|uniref:putative F-box/LRR-repeat protein 23 isoform X3 n=1 Tax=Lycium barbarum TaxID=112863 RepID=UPI00293F28BB|nr:putative F-box/LRR-repeat protein 23 isoform X3 [Lycium barbarum]
MTIPLCIAWTILSERNRRCFEDKKEMISAVVFLSKREARCTKHLALVRSGKGCTPSSGKLKRLRIAGCSFMIRVGLVEAVQKLPLLEELNLTHTAITTVGIEALGRSCPQLKSFVLNNSLDMGSGHSDKEDERNEKALAIAKNLPTLHHLQLIGNSMTNKGLEAILDGCPHLVSLDLRLCEYISLNEVLSSRISEQIKDVKYPNESLAGLRFSFEAYIWG